MSKRVVAVLAMLVVSAGTAMAQSKGGKIDWTKMEPEQAMAVAKRDGMAMMMYFTSDG